MHCIWSYFPTFTDFGKKINFRHIRVAASLKFRRVVTEQISFMDGGGKAMLLNDLLTRLHKPRQSNGGSADCPVCQNNWQ